MELIENQIIYHCKIGKCRVINIDNNYFLKPTSYNGWCVSYKIAKYQGLYYTRADGRCMIMITDSIILKLSATPFN